VVVGIAQVTQSVAVRVGPVVVWLGHVGRPGRDVGRHRAGWIARAVVATVSRAAVGVATDLRVGRGDVTAVEHPVVVVVLVARVTAARARVLGGAGRRVAADGVAVRVRLSLVLYSLAVVAGIADAVVVGVRLAGVRDRRAVVA